MTTPTCNWPIGNNQTLSFSIHAENKNWNKVAGIYIFTYRASSGTWLPLYVGQTDDFSARLPSHDRLNEAIRLGATHIHACVIPLQKDRDLFEAALVRVLQPQLNEKLK